VRGKHCISALPPALVGNRSEHCSVV
jgi:hypothetical protein